MEYKSNIKMNIVLIDGTIPNPVKNYIENNIQTSQKIKEILLSLIDDLLLKTDMKKKSKSKK